MSDQEIFAIVAAYREGGRPEIILVANNEMLVDSMIEAINSTYPSKEIYKVKPTTVLISTQKQERET